jgi:hypothetical protein
MPGVRPDGELAAELLARGEAVEIVVGGASMWPLVRHGDRVRIESDRPVVVGAIAATLRAGHLVVHRVARLEGARVILRGDHREQPDLPVAREAVLGVVTRQWTRALPAIRHDLLPLQLWNGAVSAVRARTSLPWRLAREARRVRDLLRK